ncbi:hypothetical protein DEA98_05065 [Brucella pseudogrignonensis]|nr:hypothetical protein [Brucella pseudogrignonensis]
MPATPEALSSAASLVTDMIVNLVPDLAGTPAVAPAAEAISSSTGLTARQALDINASAGAAFVVLAGDTVSRPDTVLLAGTAGDALAKAGQLAAYVEFGSRAEASALRDSPGRPTGRLYRSAIQLFRFRFCCRGQRYHTRYPRRSLVPDCRYQ